MEQGNRLGIAGITHSPLPGVVLPGNKHVLIVLSSQDEFDNVTTNKRRMLELFKYTNTEFKGGRRHVSSHPKY